MARRSRASVGMTGYHLMQAFLATCQEKKLVRDRVPGPVWEKRRASQRNQKNELYDDSKRQPKHQYEKLTFSNLIDVHAGKEFDRDQTTFHETPRFC